MNRSIKYWGSFILSLFLFQSRSGKAVNSNFPFQRKRLLTDSLNFLKQLHTIGPDTKFIVPLWQFKCLESWLVNFGQNPVLKNRTNLVLVNTEQLQIELVVLGLEVVLVLVDSLVGDGLQILNLILLWLSEIVLNQLRKLHLLKPSLLLLNHPTVPPLIISLRVQRPSILELKHLLLKIRSLVILRWNSITLLEIILVQAIFVVTQQLLLVQKLYLVNNRGTSSTRSS